jgi:hypothetical protein
LPASSKIARRFGHAPAIGFMCGRHSGVTVLDWDSTDERGFADALDRHGRTPIIARSGSGHFQAWYRHAGERRLIRPRRDVPIDILGAGFVIGPPSRVAKGSYQFIQGSLDDLDSLPTLVDAPRVAPTETPADWGRMRDGDGRNEALFRLLGRAAHHVDDFDQLLDWEQIACRPRAARRAQDFRRAGRAGHCRRLFAPCISSGDQSCAVDAQERQSRNPEVRSLPRANSR